MSEHFKQPLMVYSQLQRNALEAGPIDLRKTAATLGAVAALGIMAHATNGGAETLHAAEPAKAGAVERPGVSKSEQGLYLRDVSELPGFRMKVTRREREVLAESTLTLMSRPRVAEGETPSDWSEVCSINLIRPAGLKHNGYLAVTAAHCAIGNGSSSGSNFNFTRPASVNILPGLPDEYAVADPREYPTLRKPIGYVRGMSANQRGLDLAFLDIEADNNREPGDRSRLLKDVTKLPYKAATAPVPGQQVAITSVPYAAGSKIGSRNHIGSTVGRYVGDWHYTDNYGNTRKIAIVGIKTPRADNDKFNFGASGSSARLADGTTLSALTIRVNMGYRDGTVQPEDLYFYDPTTGQSGNYRPGKTFMSIQKELGVDLSEFDTLGGYNLNNLRGSRTLLNGFRNKVPELQILPRPVPTEPYQEGEPFPEGVESYK